MRATGVGEEAPERSTAAGAVLDPGAATAGAGELSDQGQADAGARGVVGDSAALVEGLKDPLAELGRYTGPLIFDDSRTPSSWALSRTQMVVPARVCLAALTNRFR